MALSGYRAKIKAMQLAKISQPSPTYTPTATPTMSEDTYAAQQEQLKDIMASRYGQNYDTSGGGYGGGGGEGGALQTSIVNPLTGSFHIGAPEPTSPFLQSIAQNPNLTAQVMAGQLAVPPSPLGSTYTGGGNVGGGGALQGTMHAGGAGQGGFHSQVSQMPPNPLASPLGATPGQVKPDENNNWQDPKTGKKYTNLKPGAVAGSYIAWDDQGQNVVIQPDGSVVGMTMPSQMPTAPYYLPLGEANKEYNMVTPGGLPAVPLYNMLPGMGGGGGSTYGGGGFGSHYGGGGGGGGGGQSLRDYLANLNLINWNIGG